MPKEKFKKYINDLIDEIKIKPTKISFDMNFSTLFVEAEEKFINEISKDRLVLNVTPFKKGK